MFTKTLRCGGTGTAAGASRRFGFGCVPRYMIPEDKVADLTQKPGLGASDTGCMRVTPEGITCEIKILSSLKREQRQWRTPRRSPCTTSLQSPTLTMSKRSSTTCRTGVSSPYVFLPTPPYPVPHRSVQYDPLVQPALLRQEVTTSTNAKRTIATARFNAARILAGQDDRILVIVGPCSIHSPEQALEYAKLLKEKIPDWPNLCIIMRSYL